MNKRYSGFAFEENFLPRLSSVDIEHLSKEDALVILPIGAVEQHGPHLPVYTDTLIAEGLLEEAMLQLQHENIWVLPAIPYGKSNEHLGLSGTMSLSASTLQAVVMDLAISVCKSGFKKLLLFNTHGGNHDLLNMMAREIRIETGLMVFRLNPGFEAVNRLISQQEQRFGIHGGEVETSLIMELKGDWVQFDKSPTEFVNLSNNHHLHLKGNSYFAWVMNDISNTGIAGDARQATKEKGKMMKELIVSELVKTLKEMKHFSLGDLKKDYVNK
ncbi:creatininase family protein [Priestia flexa]|uniref:Creatininase family protein n=1 Tax=Priestia flexa TaxID=86664 RepID=A0ABU4J823_9BACI|nr:MULTISPECIES: creatininase family protein [Bacillaceae]KZB92902.1 creatininase [Bacillus sp. VT 712]MBY6086365.1 creatininase family protein [Priestia flexa]MCA1201058.1 creatininase family protein [Priestia flexa]MCG7312618.1 creatininase family protein [Priestia flexa]MDW8517158.1 creatininase family protein [Priestia flexa]